MSDFSVEDGKPVASAAFPCAWLAFPSPARLPSFLPSISQSGQLCDDVDDGGKV